jgi:hypothetical protein
MKANQVERAGELLRQIKHFQKRLIAFRNADKFDIAIRADHWQVTADDLSPDAGVVKYTITLFEQMVAKDKDELATLGVEWTAADDAAIEAEWTAVNDAAIEAAVSEHGREDLGDDIPF